MSFLTESNKSDFRSPAYYYAKNYRVRFNVVKKQKIQTEFLLFRGCRKFLDIITKVLNEIVNNLDFFFGKMGYV